MIAMDRLGRYRPWWNREHAWNEMTTSPLRPTIVFDLDGTLVDTASDLIESLNYCLAKAGFSKANPSDFRQFVGFGGRAMISRACQAQNISLDESSLDELMADFLGHYSAGIPGRSRPYPGAEAAISRFAANGFTTAICTNKYESLSFSLISGLGLSQQFSAICGADTFGFRKPDPRHLTETVKMAGGDPARALMVGDSRTDIDTAKAAGLPVVAVDWGYTDRHVAEFEPDLVISHFDELETGLAERLIEKASGSRQLGRA